MTDSMQAAPSPSAAPSPALAPSLAPVPADPEGSVETHPSVRELLTELAALEDATRPLQGSTGPLAEATPEQLAALAREQEIIAELHRRCPDEPAS